MGILFRNSTYLKHVRLGKRTVKYGEAMAVWNRQGQHETIIGPKLKYLFYSTIQFLDRYSALKNEYLHIVHMDGREEICQGPFTMFKNPVLHKSVTLHSALELKSPTEFIVLLSRHSQSSMAGAEITFGANQTFKNENSSDNPAAIMDQQQSSSPYDILFGPRCYVPDLNDHSALVLEYPSFNETGPILSTLSQSWLCQGVLYRTKTGVPYHLSFSLVWKIDQVQKFAQFAQGKDIFARIQNVLILDVDNIENIGDEDPHDIQIALSSKALFPQVISLAQSFGLFIEHVLCKSITIDHKYETRIRQEREKQESYAEQFKLEERKEQLLNMEMTAARVRDETFREHELKKLEAKITEKSRMKEAEDQATLIYLEGLRDRGVDLNKYFENFANIVVNNNNALNNPQLQEFIRPYLPLMNRQHHYLDQQD